MESVIKHAEEVSLSRGATVTAQSLYTVEITVKEQIMYHNRVTSTNAKVYFDITFNITL